MAEWAYDALVEAALADHRVLGLVLTGSRGRGPFARPDSDWDIRLITRDDAADEIAAVFHTDRGSPVEAVILSLSAFIAVAEIGSFSEFDRYSYTHAQTVIDKLNGQIADLVSAKGALPSDLAPGIAAAQLDGYINSYYRSVKNAAIGLQSAAHLDAAESIPFFLNTIFAMHERVRPFNKFLVWELEQHPLGDQVWSAEMLVPRLEMITATGDLPGQQRLFRDVEAIARDRGFGAVVDSWAPDVRLLRGE